jgi:hypothetical protein
MIKVAKGTLGEPGSMYQSARVLQPYPDTCAIRSQEIILQKYGILTDHDHLVEQAIELDAYKPGDGTQAKDIGKLLDHYGLKYHQTVNANIFNITDELAHGHMIIVGVNSQELSKHGFFEAAHTAESSGADHALIVAGIDFSDPDQVKVNLKDPGSGDEAKPYPLNDFIEAWKDSDYFMVSTNEPPSPKLELPEMRYFNDEIGRLENIGEMPYEKFAQIYHELNEVNADRQESWSEMCDGFSNVVNGKQSVEDFDETVHHFLDVSHQSEVAVKETLGHFSDKLHDLHEEGIELTHHESDLTGQIHDRDEDYLSSHQAPHSDVDSIHNDGLDDQNHLFTV